MPKGRKKSAAEKQLEQSKRFEAAAKRVSADKTGKNFERALKKIIIPKSKSVPKKR